MPGALATFRLAGCRRVARQFVQSGDRVGPKWGYGGDWRVSVPGGQSRRVPGSAATSRCRPLRAGVSPLAPWRRAGEQAGHREIPATVDLNQTRALSDTAPEADEDAAR